MRESKTARTDGEMRRVPGRSDTVEVTVLPRGSYRLTSVQPCQITNSIFHRIRTENLQFWNLQKHKRPRTPEVILRKKNLAGGIRLLEFRLNYKTTVIKTVLQINGTGQKLQRPTDSPRAPYLWQRRLARIYTGVKSVFNKWCWENGTLPNTVTQSKLKMA